MKSTGKIVITCSPGIEPFLKREVMQLGYRPKHSDPNSVTLNGSLADCMKLNLHLRTASRVLLLVRAFKAFDPQQLYRELTRIPWENYLSCQNYLTVTSFIRNRHIRDGRFGNQKTKDAIVDRLYRINKKRPNSGPEKLGAVVFLHWTGGNAQIYLDTSGENLTKHGYRKIPYQAPLKESLAAAMIMATKWTPGMPLVNPMGGSGTLVIEAAMMAKGIKPGMLREKFGFMYLKGYDPTSWNRLLQEARNQIISAGSTQLYYSDNQTQAMEAAQINAELAQVKDLIHFSRSDFHRVSLPPGPGVIIFNPPYGNRLGEESELVHTYQGIGDFLKQNAPGYWGYVFTGNLQLAKKIGLRSSRKIPFVNGPLECRLLEFELYDGSKKIQS